MAPADIRMRRPVFAHAADGNAGAQPEEPELLFKPEEVEASLRLRLRAPRRKVDSSSSTPEQPEISPQRKARLEELEELEGLRNVAQQHTGLTKHALSARVKALSTVVPVLKEEQVLQQRPSVLRELCSEEGASTAATRLVQLKSGYVDLPRGAVPTGVLDLVQRCPELLTASGQHNVLLSHTSLLQRVAFAQHGTVLVSMDAPSFGGELNVWKLQGTRPSVAIPLIPPSWDDVEVLAFTTHPDSRYVLVGGRTLEYYCPPDESVLGVWDLETQQWVAEGRAAGSESMVALFVFSDAADTHLVVSRHHCGSLQLWELGTEADGSPTVQHKGFVKAGDKQTLLTLFSDITGRQPTSADLAAITACETVLSGVADSGGRRLAATAAFLDISVWDTQTAQVLAAFSVGKEHNAWIMCVDVSPDGRHMAVGFSCGGLLIWDLRNQQRAGFVECVHNEGVSCLAFSPDGQVLATSGCDGLLRLWDWGELQALGAQGIKVKPGYLVRRAALHVQALESLRKWVTSASNVLSRVTGSLYNVIRPR